MSAETICIEAHNVNLQQTLNRQLSDNPLYLRIITLSNRKLSFNSHHTALRHRLVLIAFSPLRAASCCTRPTRAVLIKYHHPPLSLYKVHYQSYHHVIPDIQLQFKQTAQCIRAYSRVSERDHAHILSC